MRERRWRQMVTSELDLLPLMNIFIVLIPLLLLSAVFVQVSVIKMDAPAGGAAAGTADSGESLDLAVHVTADAYVVEGSGLPARTIVRTAGAGGTPVDAEALEQLQAALVEVVAAHPDEKSVRIVAGARTHYDEIVDVMDATRAAGLPQVALTGDGGGS